MPLNEIRSQDKQIFTMTGKEQRKLRKIVKRITIQSEHHAANITEYYKIMAEAARLQFPEDNDVTLEGFLCEQFRKAFDTSRYQHQLIIKKE